MSEARHGPGQRKRQRSDVSDTSDTPSDDELLADVRTGAWLDEQAFPPMVYAVDGLLPEGSSLVVGPPKAGKSLLMLDLLLAVASGGAALGHIKVGAPRPVLYVALEDGDRRMQARCRKLLERQPIPPLFAYKLRVEPRMLLATIQAWMRRRPDTAMVVVDTLGKVMPPAAQGESAYQRDYRVGTALKAVADDHRGLAVAVIHHDRKASAEDFVDAVSGTHGLAGAADTVVVLLRRRHSDDGLLKVTGRDVPENAYALKLTDGMVWQLDGADLREAAEAARRRDDGANLGERSTEILAAVRQHPGGVRAKDLADRFGPDVYQYLRRLEEGGHVDKVARGRYVARVPSEPSEVSDSQVSGYPQSDTVRFCAECGDAEDSAWHAARCLTPGPAA